MRLSLLLTCLLLVTGVAQARIDTESSLITLDGKRYALIVAIERDDQTGAVLRVQQSLVLLEDDTEIPEPRLVDTPPLRQKPPNLTPLLADIDSRMPAGHPFRANDPWTWGHETTHGINNRLRNDYMRAHPQRERVNAFYVPGGKAIYCHEPKTTIGRVAQLIPRSLRGMRYNLYLVQQRRDWDNEPLYLLDEWISYINGALVFQETDSRIQDNWIVTPGALEFAVYGTCVAWAANSDDEQLKRTLAYLWLMSLDIYESDPRPESHSVLTSLQHDPDAQSLREFCVGYFGEPWTNKHLMRPLSAPKAVAPGGKHWLPPRHSPDYFNPKPVQATYPTRGSWWTFPGNTREQLIYHLQLGEHAGKFDSRWLQTLTMAQLQSLHSDDHERRVNWGYVQKPNQVTVYKQIQLIHLKPVTPYWLQPARPQSSAAFCPT